MRTKLVTQARLLVAVTALSFVAPAVAAGQGTGIRVSVQGAVGSNLGDGGDAEAVSLGVMFRERFGVVVNGERSHVPTDVTFFENGYSASRGGTVTSVSGEFRYVPVTYKRISPYVIAGLGLGVSRPNVNKFFPNPPDPVEHNVILQFFGGGGSVRVTEHASAFVDFRVMLLHRRGEPDAGIFGPIRGGLAWRF
jgi:hypothetical protein